MLFALAAVYDAPSIIDYFVNLQEFDHTQTFKNGYNILHLAVLNRSALSASYIMKNDLLQGLVKGCDDNGLTPFLLCITNNDFWMFRLFSNFLMAEDAVSIKNNVGSNWVDYGEKSECSCISRAAYLTKSVHNFESVLPSMLANKATQLDDLVNFAEHHIDWKDMKYELRKIYSNIYYGVRDMPEMDRTKIKIKINEQIKDLSSSRLCAFLKDHVVKNNQLEFCKYMIRDLPSFDITYADGLFVKERGLLDFDMYVEGMKNGITPIISFLDDCIDKVLCFSEGHAEWKLFLQCLEQYFEIKRLFEEQNQKLKGLFLSGGDVETAEAIVEVYENTLSAYKDKCKGFDVEKLLRIATHNSMLNKDIFKTFVEDTVDFLAKANESWEMPEHLQKWIDDRWNKL